MAPTGIQTIHQSGCAARTSDRRCSCSPSYEASAYSARDRKKIRRTFATLAAARAWRAEAVRALNRGELQAETPALVRDAADVLLAGMRSGTVRTRSGDRYKPSVIRGYEQALRLHVLDDLGGVRLGRLRRRDVQSVADRMLAAGMNPSTIRNALMPLRVIYRRALEDGEIAVNPCSGVRLPAVRGRRERIASPSEAARLLAALPESDGPLWATAVYAGLRAGELRALRWSAVNLAAGVIRVEQSMDHRGELVAPKSAAGRRSVPIAAALRDLLATHKITYGSQRYVFGASDGRPFSHSTVLNRARREWRKAGLEPIGLHECRHTCASLMIAAGVNAKALTVYMGHSSIDVTFDRYGHLMPGNESEAAALLDAYLARADTSSRMRQLDL